MQTVFISSVQYGFADVRDAAAKAIETCGMHPLMAEKTGASTESAQRALLDEVRKSDVVLLLLGPRYGEPGESGFSPTEDEYREAIRLGKDVLVLTQNVELGPDQTEFLKRTRGSWEAGKLTGTFDDSSNVG